MLHYTRFLMNAAAGFPAANLLASSQSELMNSALNLSGGSLAATTDSGLAQQNDTLWQPASGSDEAAQFLAQQGTVVRTPGAVVLHRDLPTAMTSPRSTSTGLFASLRQAALNPILSATIFVSSLIGVGCSGQAENPTLNDAVHAAMPDQLDQAHSVEASFRLFVSEPLPSADLAANQSIDLSVLSGPVYESFIAALAQEHPDLHQQWQTHVSAHVEHFRAAGNTDGNANQLSLGEVQTRFNQSVGDSQQVVRDLRMARSVISEFGRRVGEAELSRAEGHDDEPLTHNPFAWLSLLLLLAGAAGAVFVFRRLQELQAQHSGQTAGLTQDKQTAERALSAQQEQYRKAAGELAQLRELTEQLTGAREKQAQLPALEQQVAQLQPAVARAEALQKELVLGLEQAELAETLLTQKQAAQDRTEAAQREAQRMAAQIEEERKKLRGRQRALSDNLDRVAALRTDVEAQEQQNPHLEQQIEALERQLRDRVFDNNQLRWLQLRLGELHTEHPDIDRRIAYIETQIRTVEERLIRLGELRSEHEGLLAEHPTLDRDITDLEQSLTEIKAQLRRRADLETEQDRLTAENPRLGQEIVELDGVIAELSEAHTNLREQLAGRERNRDDLLEHKAASEAALEGVNGEIEELVTDRQVLEAARDVAAERKDALEGAIKQALRLKETHEASIERLEARETQLGEQNTGLQGRETQLSATVSGEELAAKALQESIDELEQRLATARTEIAERTEALEAAETELANKGARKEELIASIAAAEAAITRLNEDIPQLEDQSTQKLERKGELSQELSELRELFAQQEAAEAGLTHDISEANGKIAALTERIGQLETNLTERESEHRQLSSRKQSLADEIERTVAEIAQLNIDIEALLETRAEVSHQLGQLRIARTGREQELAGLREDILSIEQGIKDLVEQRIPTAESALASLREKQASETSTLASLSEEIERAETDLEGLKAQRVAADQRLEVLLGDEQVLNAVVTELDQGIAEKYRNLTVLRQTQTEKQAELAELKTTAEGLQADNAGIDTAIAAHRQEISEIEGKVSTHRELLERRGAVESELSALEAENPLEQVELAVEQASERLSVLKEQIEELGTLRVERDNLTSRYPNITEQIGEQHGRIREAKERVKTLEATLARATTQHGELAQRTSEIQAEIAQLEAEVGDIESSIQERDELQQRRIGLVGEDGSIAQVEQEVEDLRAELSALDEKISERNILSGNLEMVRGDNQGLGAELTDLHQDIEVAEADKVRLQEELERKTAALAGLIARSDELTLQLQAREESLRLQEEAHADLENQKETLARILRETEDTRNSIEGTRHEIELAQAALTPLQAELEQAKQQLATWEKTAPELVAQKDRIDEAVRHVVLLMSENDRMKFELERLARQSPDLFGALLKRYDEGEPTPENISIVELLIAVAELQTMLEEAKASMRNSHHINASVPFEQVTTWPVPKGRPIILGRSDNADISLETRGISGRHAELWWHGDKVFIRDLGSDYGTVIQGDGIPDDLQQGSDRPVYEHGGQRIGGQWVATSRTEERIQYGEPYQDEQGQWQRKETPYTVEVPEHFWQNNEITEQDPGWTELPMRARIRLGGDTFFELTRDEATQAPRLVYHDDFTPTPPERVIPPEARTVFFGSQPPAATPGVHVEAVRASFVAPQHAQLTQNNGHWELTQLEPSSHTSVALDLEPGTRQTTLGFLYLEKRNLHPQILKLGFKDVQELQDLVAAFDSSNTSEAQRGELLARLPEGRRSLTAARRLIHRAYWLQYFIDKAESSDTSTQVAQHGKSPIILRPGLQYRIQMGGASFTIKLPEVSEEPFEEQVTQVSAMPLSYRYEDLIQEGDDGFNQLTLHDDITELYFGRAQAGTAGKGLFVEEGIPRIRLVSPGGRMSGTHARIFRVDDGQFALEDSGSTAGTYLRRLGESASEVVSDEQVTNPRILEEGDTIFMGDVILEVAHILGNGDDLEEIVDEDAAAEIAAPGSPIPWQESVLRPRDGKPNLWDLQVPRGISEVIIGRGDESVPVELTQDGALRINMPSGHVSGKHAKISLYGDGRFVVTDLGSSNGTRFVSEDASLSDPIEPGKSFYLDPDQAILLGNQIIHFQGQQSPAPVEGSRSRTTQQGPAARAARERRRLAQLEHDLENYPADGESYKGLFDRLMTAKGQVLRHSSGMTFQVKTLWGIGSEGFAFLADWEGRSQSVIVKQPHLNYMNSAKYAGLSPNEMRTRYRFGLQREADMLSKSDFFPKPIALVQGAPALVQGIAEGSPLAEETYLVEEYIPGLNLGDSIRQEWGRLTPQEREYHAFQFASQFMQFWQDLRRKAYHYADINPNNFIYDLKTGRLRVLDPGSAHRVTGDKVRIPGFSPQFTTPKLAERLTSAARKSRNVPSDWSTVFPMLAKIIVAMIRAEIPEPQPSMPVLNYQSSEGHTNQLMAMLKAFLSLDSHMTEQRQNSAYDALLNWQRAWERIELPGRSSQA